ncbi:uncharacterized protein LOC122509309 isoform X1 [Leptopilina heterotoma]|uniref:uncharacterized protein LOC122509309 isoform X1 n=1 Tax=Leptopilina heterotoma TaxID=63436 RepID=UPI001CA97CEE|nr:uncharacterized protein LOC122509309 isoform X1 [Leptopilina heterotoma]
MMQARYKDVPNLNVDSEDIIKKYEEHLKSLNDQLSKFRTLEDEELQNAYKMNHRLYRMINTATSGATWLKPNILIYDTVGQRIMFLAFFVVHFFVLNFII